MIQTSKSGGHSSRVFVNFTTLLSLFSTACYNCLRNFFVTLPITA
ncbi:hypothetical protein BACCAP_02757 [Pseudoflavonifractor capillosus ATCC 29799]|uniref:Uncharacterized protein n=1 Tax=Pseudoflavonifractor capillosus ATCC 29799 TaxID=411467 RepID=A6NX12_9FIRM|nr:hypothetical protein BACCAP_02757 [Pseudoflavonifractor capillosus ATCC 29799]